MRSNLSGTWSSWVKLDNIQDPVRHLVQEFGSLTLGEKFEYRISKSELEKLQDDYELVTKKLYDIRKITQDRNLINYYQISEILKVLDRY